MKRVYLEPAGRWHSAYKELKLYPPEGYEYVTNQTVWDKGLKPLINDDFAYFTLSRFIGRLLPTHLVKARLEALFKRRPPNTDLTYAFNHLVFRKEPWVVHVEWPTALTGFSVEHLKRYKATIERTLASSYCKKIITWSEVAKRSILLNLDSTSLEPKLEVVNFAVHSKNFAKTYSDGRVKLLFVGSENIPGEFDLKGGKEVLEGFILLSKKYDNLELVVRSDMPQEIKHKYQVHPKIRLIERVIPWEELEQEFKTADIFLFPGYYTPWKAILDAMSYELPVIITDASANPELVADGETGLLIKASEEVPYFQQNFIPTEHTPLRRQFKKTIKAVDSKVVEDLVSKVSILIENPGLRQRMGRAGRWEVEHGRFSIKNRNEKLKRIFDEATG